MEFTPFDVVVTLFDAQSLFGRRKVHGLSKFRENKFFG